MRFDVCFGGFAGVMRCVEMVAMREVRMVGGLFMTTRFMMLGRFLVVVLSVTVMLRSLVMVFGSLL